MNFFSIFCKQLSFTESSFLVKDRIDMEEGDPTETNPKYSQNAKNQRKKLFHFFQRIRTRKTALDSIPQTENVLENEKCNSLDQISNESLRFESRSAEKLESLNSLDLSDQRSETSCSISGDTLNGSTINDSTESDEDTDIQSHYSRALSQRSNVTSSMNSFIHQRKQNQKLTTVSATVALLNGEVLRLSASRNVGGRFLFDIVQMKVQIEEMAFFGLACYSLRKKMWFWLREEKRVRSQLKGM